VVGTTLTSTNGTYTANYGGAAGTHTYQWKSSDDAGMSVNVTNLATSKDYTPVGADFGKYIRLETTPVGTTGLTGVAVQGAAVQVGVTLTINIAGAGGGTAPLIDGVATASLIVYGQATLSFTKTTATDLVAWTASPNEGVFGDATAVSTTYTPATAPSAGTITLTATLTAPTFTVTYNLDGGTQQAGTWDAYTSGVGMTLPTAPTKANHTFAGWYDNAALTGSPVTTISTTETGNKVFWAKWTAHIAPILAGPTSLTLTEGYAATTTGIYTATGFPDPTVTKKSGDAAITWSSATMLLSI
jgi:uncharacterized repeat protein (TIGR02543 family)